MNLASSWIMAKVLLMMLPKSFLKLQSNFTVQPGLFRSYIVILWWKNLLIFEHWSSCRDQFLPHVITRTPDLQHRLVNLCQHYLQPIDYQKAVKCWKMWLSLLPIVQLGVLLGWFTWPAALEPAKEESLDREFLVLVLLQGSMNLKVGLHFQLFILLLKSVAK